MAGTVTPKSPTREIILRALRETGGGQLVGLRPIISGAPINPVFLGWFVAGTVGYLEMGTDYDIYLAGVWRPEETYGM